MTMVTVANGTNVRLAGRFDEDNVIAVTHADKYEALHQCRGAFHQEGDQSNVWWVKIALGDGVEGWVHAVRITEGGDDQPIPDVPEQDVHEAKVTKWR
jgi:hypothetical protein